MAEDRAIWSLRFDTADANKRRVVAAILLAAAFVEKPQQLDVEALLGTISNLSPQDFALTRLFYEESGGEEPKAIVTGVVGLADCRDRNFHLKRLEADGLINEKTDATYGYQGGEIGTRPSRVPIARVATDP